jgi:hypothetical protein
MVANRSVEMPMLEFNIQFRNAIDFFGLYLTSSTSASGLYVAVTSISHLRSADGMSPFGGHSLPCVYGLLAAYLFLGLDRHLIASPGWGPAISPGFPPTYWLHLATFGN